MAANGDRNGLLLENIGPIFSIDSCLSVQKWPKNDRALLSFDKLIWYL